MIRHRGLVGGHGFVLDDALGQPHVGIVARWSFLLHDQCGQHDHVGIRRSAGLAGAGLVSCGGAYLGMAERIPCTTRAEALAGGTGSADCAASVPATA